MVPTMVTPTKLGDGEGVSKSYDDTHACIIYDAIYSIATEEKEKEEKTQSFKEKEA